MMSKFVLRSVVNPDNFVAVGGFGPLSAALTFDSPKAALDHLGVGGLNAMVVPFDEASATQQDRGKPLGDYRDPFGLGAEWVARQKVS
jgi:hypothetical protein